MSKKKLFDKHLYKEGMRSLIPFGSVLLGLLCVFSILYSVSFLLDYSTEYYSYSSDLIYLTDQFAIIYFLIIVFVVPILTLRSFSFLTTRNGSDFYHAIPHKKQCVYLSFALAIFTWTFICTAVPTTISYIIFAFAGINVISIGMFLLAILHILVASLLVMGAICIACSITGTILTNIITTGLILFFPRIFLFACRLILCTLTNQLLPGNGFLLGTRCNLVIQSIINFSNTDYYLFSLAPLIYTLLLSILYLFLAAILLERRHSELAMKPALSKRFQAFICLLLGTSFSLIPIGLITISSRYDEPITINSVFAMITIYIIIIIGMGIYELLTTKKVKNLIHIIPRTGILAVINLVIIGCLFGGQKLIYSYIPDASKIDSVSFTFSHQYSGELLNSSTNHNSPFVLGGSSFSDYYTSYEDNYFTLKCDSYSTSDETVKEIIANSMKATAKPIYDYDSYTLLVTIDTGLTSMTRNIRIKSKDYSTLRSHLLADPSFTSIYTNLPDVSKNNLYENGYNNSTLTKDEAKEVYELLKEEIASLKNNEWINVLSNDDGYIAGTLSFGTRVGTSYQTGSIPISSSLPKSYQKYIDFINAKNKDSLSSFAQALSSYNTDRFTYMLDICGSDCETGKSPSYLNVYLSNTQLKDSAVTDLINALVKSQNSPVDITKKDTYIVNTSAIISDNSTDKREVSTQFIQIDKATFDSLIVPVNALVDRYNNSEYSGNTYSY